MPKGESFEARREKHGITVYYVDDKGKARTQLYTLVNDEREGWSAPDGRAVASQPSPGTRPKMSRGQYQSPPGYIRAGAEFTVPPRGGLRASSSRGESKV